jgi:hypothetical protein
MTPKLQPNSGDVTMTLTETADALGVPVRCVRCLVGRRLSPPWAWPDLHGEPIFDEQYLSDWRDILEINGLCGK